MMLTFWNSFPQFQDAELYYRVVNMRDMEVQSLVNISAANYNQYRAPVVSVHPPSLASLFWVEIFCYTLALTIFSGSFVHILPMNNQQAHINVFNSLAPDIWFSWQELNDVTSCCFQIPPPSQAKPPSPRVLPTASTGLGR